MLMNYLSTTSSGSATRSLLLRSQRCHYYLLQRDLNLAYYYHHSSSKHFSTSRSFSNTSPMFLDNVQRISAFSHNNKGGNPAGVLILSDDMPSDQTMMSIAKDVGYSETAFLKKRSNSDNNNDWNIRYFAPEMEVPFCGHATIASGSALGQHYGLGMYQLYLSSGANVSIEVSSTTASGDDADNKDLVYTTTLQSPGTWSKDADKELIDSVFDTFGNNLTASEHADTDRFPIRLAHGGSTHLIIAFKDKATLSEMSYDFDKLKTIMEENDLVTVNLVWLDDDSAKKDEVLFHSRNLFPPGGVYEDPATGSAAAALGGYLRDIGFDNARLSSSSVGTKATNCKFEILQGFDMGVPSRLLVEFNDKNVGEGIYVTGETRQIAT